MDKYEYRVKLVQLEKLVEKKDYVTAAKIADGIDWRKVRSVTTLNMVADVYEETDRLEDCYEILSLIYDRSAVGRNVVYRMTEVATKMKDFEEAIELYKEYVNIAPHDLSRYILKYQIYKARGSSVSDQIEILEEYKSHEYDERWAYELACLYEEAGMIDRCVEECDELIKWFSEGEYVARAMELKMKYQELTASQKEKFEHRFDYMEQSENIEDKSEEETGITEASDNNEAQGTEEKIAEEETPEVKVINTNKFSTINLQEELAKGLQRILSQVREESAAEEPIAEKTEASIDEPAAEKEEASIEEPAAEKEEASIEEPVTEKAEAFIEEKIEENEAVEETPEEPETEEAKEPAAEEIPVSEPVMEEAAAEELLTAEESAAQEEPVVGEEAPVQKLPEEKRALSETAEIKAELLKYVSIPQERSMEEMFRTEEDGQITLAIGEEDVLEKQITGQMTIEEILEAWEEKKRQAREQIEKSDSRREAVLLETGEITSLLKDFIPRTPKDVQELIDEIEAAEKRYAEEIPAQEPADEEAPEEEAIEAISLDELYFETGEEEPAEELEDDLPLDIDLAEALEASLQEAEKKEEEKKVPKVPEKRPMGENTADMLDAIERALVLEMTPSETAGKYLTEEQEEIFAYFMRVRGMKKQLVKLLAGDHVYAGRGDSKEGNLIITGHPGNGKTTLAIDIVKAIQKQRKVKGGKLAKVTGDGFNKKNPDEVIKKLGGGALIIERAGGLSAENMEKLCLAMEGETNGLLVILEDDAAEIAALLEKNQRFADKFNRSVEIPIFTNDELVAFGKSYAAEREFYFDEMATLALYDCIGVRQTSDHVVNVAEVKAFVDDAVAHAEKKSRGFFVKLSKKRVDEDGNKLLLEEDFDF